MVKSINAFLTQAPSEDPLEMQAMRILIQFVTIIGAVHLGKARDQTHVLLDAHQVHQLLSPDGNSLMINF